MKTTIDLDDGLLRTAMALSEIRRQTLSAVICDLAWNSLRPEPVALETRNGFPILPRRTASMPVTAEHVNDLLYQADLEDVTLGFQP